MRQRIRPHDFLIHTTMRFKKRTSIYLTASVMIKVPPFHTADNQFYFTSFSLAHVLYSCDLKNSLHKLICQEIVGKTAGIYKTRGLCYHDNKNNIRTWNIYCEECKARLARRDLDVQSNSIMINTTDIGLEE